MRPLFAFLASLILFCECHRPQSDRYTVGLDPTWYPLQVAGKEKNIYAFSLDILTAIAKQENLQIGIITANWDNLMWGLRKKNYQAVLSTLRPYTFYLKDYAFSIPYLKTGPAVILPKETTSDRIEGKAIGVVTGSQAAILLQVRSSILIKGYDSIPAIFEALEADQIAGAAIEVLTAGSYLRDLYPGKYRFASAPLNDMGLRLVSIKGEEKELMSRFDKGLNALKKTGEYDKLLNKWGLSR